MLTTRQLAKTMTLNDSIKGLSPIPLDVRRMARDMRRELIDFPRVVILVPAPKPMHSNHKVRLVENDDPEWYKRLLASKMITVTNKNGTTRQKSDIRRAWVIRSLARIAGGKIMPRHDSMDERIIQYVYYETEKQRADNAPAPF